MLTNALSHLFSIFPLIGDVQNQLCIKEPNTVSILSILLNSIMAWKNRSFQQMAPKPVFSPLPLPSLFLSTFHPQENIYQQRPAQVKLRGRKSPVSCQGRKK